MDGERGVFISLCPGPPLSLSLALSLGLVPAEEQKLGEQRDEVTSSASDRIPAEGEGEEEGGNQGRGGECPKTFEVTGPTSPHLKKHSSCSAPPLPNASLPVRVCAHVFQYISLCMCVCVL